MPQRKVPKPLTKLDVMTQIIDEFIVTRNELEYELRPRLDEFVKHFNNRKSQYYYFFFRDTLLTLTYRGDNKFHIDAVDVNIDKMSLNDLRINYQVYTGYPDQDIIPFEFIIHKYNEILAPRWKVKYILEDLSTTNDDVFYYPNNFLYFEQGLLQKIYDPEINYYTH